MSFWFREVLGWLLVLFGLLVLYDCYFLLAKERSPIEAGPLVIVGVVIFRGGIHLLKVALAARICREARERTKPQRQAVRPAVPAATVNRLAGR
jgi:hypothetical protein